MSSKLQTILQITAGKILRPLIRVMLRNGVACGNFEEMVRKAYVDEAFSLARQQGKATISSVSAQTGLSRKEVKRLHELKQNSTSANDNTQKYNRAVRVISGWLNDTEFSSAEGVARALGMEGESDSFASLVKKYSGDIPTRAMFDLLQNSGCIEKIDGKVYLTSHAYVPGNDPVDVINILGNDTNELMDTVIYNMSCDKQARRYQRKVSTKKLAHNHIEAFQKYSSRRSQSLLEDLDNWLSDHESHTEKDSRYISLGIYFYQQDNSLNDNEETSK